MQALGPRNYCQQRFLNLSVCLIKSCTSRKIKLFSLSVRWGFSNNSSSLFNGWMLWCLLWCIRGMPDDLYSNWWKGAKCRSGMKQKWPFIEISPYACIFIHIKCFLHILCNFRGRYATYLKVNFTTVFLDIYCIHVTFNSTNYHLDVLGCQQINVSIIEWK